MKNTNSNQMIKFRDVLNYTINESAEVEKLADRINKTLDDSLSYKDFAAAIGKILKDEYGSHLYSAFIQELNNELKKESNKSLPRNEDLMSTLGGERPYGDAEMRKNIVEPNLGKNYDVYIMFKGQYDQAKNKYVKDMENWKQLYRSSNYQGSAYISPDGNVIKAAILDGGGIVGAIYVKKQGEIYEGQDHEVSMANNSLDSILWAVQELKKHLGDQERDIPAWIQDHITNAENFITQAAKNFHDYETDEPKSEPSDDMSLTSIMEAKKNKSRILKK